MVTDAFGVVWFWWDSVKHPGIVFWSYISQNYQILCHVCPPLKVCGHIENEIVADSIMVTEITTSLFAILKSAKSRRYLVLCQAPVY